MPLCPAASKTHFGDVIDHARLVLELLQSPALLLQSQCYHNELIECSSKPGLPLGCLALRLSRRTFQRPRLSPAQRQRAKDFYFLIESSRGANRTLGISSRRQRSCTSREIAFSLRFIDDRTSIRGIISIERNEIHSTCHSGCLQSSGYRRAHGH